MSKKQESIDLENINESRTFIMGIATLWIVFFHMSELNFNLLINNKLLANILTLIKGAGNCGVDIFLFLSGIGLYISLNKNSTLKFYKNRIIRIIPTYIIAIIIYIFIKSSYYYKGIELITLSSFFINGDRTFWYIQFILLMYIIFPLIYKIINKKDLQGLLIILFIYILFNFIYQLTFPKSYYTLEIALNRIPIFLIGAYFGKKISNKDKINKIYIILSFITILLITIIMYLFINDPRAIFFERYLYCLYAICLTLVFSWLYSKIKYKKGLIIFDFLGKHSLEIYLLYEQLCYYLSIKISQLSINKIYIIGLIITILLSYIIKKITNILFYNKKT